ncbi:MAG: hypothetical protein IOB84_13745 [Brevundimonas sp.]|nr:hypothetical protein [Brevundimonas sp.]
MNVRLTIADEFELDRRVSIVGWDWPRRGYVTTWRGIPVEDEHTGRPYLPDEHGRRWLLDGSGDVA